MVATKNKPHPLSPGSTKSNTAAKQKSNNNSKKKRGYCSTPHESIGWNPLPVSDAPSVHDSRGSPTAALPIQSTITKVPINVKRSHGGFSGPLLPP
mmetsp:Transcript_10483/g.11878  ORF Transcript_10483/g.11878 Transcript_10483/m.11878 type:complete len:96 (+) Transcript_10483:523-810(+)